MKSFKSREKVLTRLRGLLVAAFSIGLRIIVRLYPMPSRCKDSKALINKHLTAFLMLNESCKEKGFFTTDREKGMTANPLLIRFYRLAALNKMLKLCKVLTCKLPACQVFTCPAFACGGKTGHPWGYFYKYVE